MLQRAWLGFAGGKTRKRQRREQWRQLPACGSHYSQTGSLRHSEGDSYRFVELGELPCRIGTMMGRDARAPRA